MNIQRILAAAAVSGALCVAPARADDPGPPNSTVPNSIMLVGSAGGVSDPRGTFTVVARDLAQNPLAGAYVTVDLSRMGDVRVSTASDPGLTVDCAQHTVTAITDQTGRAFFSIRGGSRSGPPTTFSPLGRIYIDGVLQANIPVSTPDLDGSGGVGATDLSLWIDDYLLGTSPVRSDFNGNGVLTALDLATWLDVFLAGGSATSDASCP